MHVGVGISIGKKAAEAARGAAEEALRQAGCPRADAVLCFATPDYFSEADVLLDALRAACGTEVVVGGSGAGVLTAKEEVEGTPGVVVLALSSSLADQVAQALEAITLEDLCREREKLDTSQALSHTYGFNI